MRAAIVRFPLKKQNGLGQSYLFVQPIRNIPTESGDTDGRWYQIWFITNQESLYP